MLLALTGLYLVLLAAGGGLAARFGGWRERTAWGALLANWLACLALTRPNAGWAEVQWGQFWPDLALFAVLSGCSLGRGPGGLAAAAGLQGAAVLIHLSFAVFPGLWPPAYATALQGLSWGLIVSLLVATLHRARGRLRPPDSRTP